MGDWKKRTNRAAQIGNLVEREEEGGGEGTREKGKWGRLKRAVGDLKPKKGQWWEGESHSLRVD